MGRPLTEKTEPVVLSGGYLLTKVPGLRDQTYAHTGALSRPLSGADMDALNAIQATPWAINRWVADVMMEAWASGRRLGGLECGEPISAFVRPPEHVWAAMSEDEQAAMLRAVEPRIPDSVWSRMPEEDRKVVKERRAAIYSQNAEIRGKSNAIMADLSVSRELRDRPAIWYPHSKDFRGRVYPCASYGPNPQGSDIGKSLLHFADGLPLGPDGLYWLLVRAANTFGLDKLSMDDRVAWSLNHLEPMAASVADPFGQTWWASTEEDPWSFLSTAHELTLAMAEPTPEAFVSHLPIPLDGSCNGLQHLSAMALDPVGAFATNLTASPDRQDIYERVAERVRAAVERDALAGVDEARGWIGNITRKTVKRAVMTTPYGVTDRGIRQQLIMDRLVPNAAIGGGREADYLRDRIVEALTDTVGPAKAIMAWLQAVAERLARAGLPFDWVTPSGSRIRQAYYMVVQTTIRTLEGRLTLTNEEPKGGLNPRKQALGAAPNFIHSFDASHMTKTVNACVSRGITHFAMIHDSYATHAANTTAMAAILREQFVAIYKDDWLRLTYDEVRRYAPHVSIPEPPARGTFDLTEVLNAPFFFS